MKIFGFPIRVWHVIVIFVLLMWGLGHYGLIKPVSGTGTMATYSDFTAKLSSGPKIGDTTIPYWSIGLAIIVFFIFTQSGGRPKGTISTQTLTQETKFYPLSK